MAGLSPPAFSTLDRSRRHLSDALGITSLLEGLSLRWSEPHRHYHVLSHLDACLANAWLLTTHSDGLDINLELAIWYHDAIYDPTATDNELRSADLAVSELDGTLSEADLAEIHRLIMITAGHGSPGTDLGKVMVDADLSILGASTDDYRSYAVAVRQEFEHLDDETFRQGRSTFLAAMVERSDLFFTQKGRDLWHDKAIKNMSAELAELSRS